MINAVFVTLLLVFCCGLLWGYWCCFVFVALVGFFVCWLWVSDFFCLFSVELLVVVIFCGWGVFGWIFPWDSLRRFRLDLALT
tara:strand:- start:559 stop:807 length:249 start_codon:yes stop_codon:yes gene_type:complete